MKKYYGKSNFFTMRLDIGGGVCYIINIVMRKALKNQEKRENKAW